MIFVPPKIDPLLGGLKKFVWHCTNQSKAHHSTVKEEAQPAMIGISEIVEQAPFELDEEDLEIDAPDLDELEMLDETERFLVACQRARAQLRELIQPFVEPGSGRRSYIPSNRDFWENVPNMFDSHSEAARCLGVSSNKVFSEMESRGVGWDRPPTKKVETPDADTLSEMKESMTIKEMCDELDIARATLYRHFDQKGVETNGREDERVDWPDDFAEWMSDKTAKEAAKELGCSRQSVYYKADREGCPEVARDSQ
ncbi:MAG: hypothetical protein ABEN55_03920 [Bradymonadaceae bacterium]